MLGTGPHMGALRMVKSPVGASEVEMQGRELQAAGALAQGPLGHIQLLRWWPL